MQAFRHVDVSTRMRSSPLIKTTSGRIHGHRYLPASIAGLRLRHCDLRQCFRACRACSPVTGPNDGNTATPIKHLIVIYGENRSFDHLFGTYKPQHGEKVMNLLSQGIVDEFGAPGPNFAKAAQFQATDTTQYSIAPTKTNAYSTLPPPNTGFAPTHRQRHHAAAVRDGGRWRGPSTTACCRAISAC